MDRQEVMHGPHAGQRLQQESYTMRVTIRAASLAACKVGLLCGALLLAGCGSSSNPVPSISSLSPTSLKVGSAAQTLTINGANLLATSTVTYNGTAHAATYISSSQLAITLTASDLYALGNYPVVVSNPGPGGGASSPVSFQVYGEAQNSTVVGSIVPSSSYELDAFDIQGNYAYILGDNGNQGVGSSAAQFYVVDITNPASMAVVSATSIIGSIGSGQSGTGQSGIRVQGKYVYLESSTGTASTNLLQIYDVSNPSAPAFVGSVQIPLYGFGLWVSGDYAYVISFVGPNSISTLDVVDVSNPASPTIVGSTNTGTAGLNVADIKVVGKYAYVAGQSNGQSEILVFDISNPASPYLLSSLPAGHSPQGLDVEGNFWYQTIYDNDLTYGVPSLDIYNISNPSTFYQVGTAVLSGTCHAQDVTVEGTTAYVACYTNSSVAVVDVSNPTSPSVKGYISLPATSYPIFLESKGRYVYSISNVTGGMLSVIDTGQ